MKEKPGRPPKHLLVGGISRCGVCGLQLYSRPERGGITRYVCAGPPEHQGCGRISIRSGPVDAFVVHAVITALAGPALDRLLAGADSDEDKVAADQLERDRSSLVQLAKDYYDRGLIGKDEFFANRGPLQERIDRVQAQLARRASAGVLKRIPRTRERLQTAWDVWTLDQRQAVLRMVLDAVVVNKAQHVGRRFDAGRVKLVWRV